MMRPFHIICRAALLLSILVATGCAAVVIGAGAGAGVYTWVKGELIRSYANDFATTEKAVLKSLDYLKIEVYETNRKISQTTVKAREKDGSPVKIVVRTVRFDLTEVAIRCGHVGYWNREDAELIHATILGNV